MKYTIITDENKYLLELSANENGVEVPTYVFATKHINCWKYENDAFTFDAEKDAEMTRKETEEEEHEAKVEAQTKNLAEMFVASGESSTDFINRIDAQTLYTALMTDTLIESEEEVDE